MKRRLTGATDGSNLGGEKFGWAYALADEDGEVLSSAQGSDLWDETWTGSWNIAAECTAVLKLVEYVIAEYKDSLGSVDPFTPDPVELEIVYDYRGLGEWATGAWAARKPVSIGYIEELSKLLWQAKWLTLSWKWVPGHDGHLLNELVDGMAKDAMRGEVSNSHKHLEHMGVPEPMVSDGKCRCTGCDGFVIDKDADAASCESCGGSLTIYEVLRRVGSQLSDLHSKGGE